jgi:hypothetical protein
VGAFASLFQLDLRAFSEPVLVMKTEEPAATVSCRGTLSFSPG